MSDKFDFDKVWKEQGPYEALRQRGYWEGAQIVTRRVLLGIVKKGGKTLDEAMDILIIPEDERYEYTDLDKEEGREEGIETITRRFARTLMRLLDMSMDEAMDALRIPEDERDRYRDLGEYDPGQGRTMFDFMELADGTEISYSDTYFKDGVETVKVFLRREADGESKTAECYLPKYEWKNVHGFSDIEIAYLNDYVKSLAHIIIRLAREKR